MSFLRASGVVLGGQVLNALLGVATLVLATRLLAPELFAELQVFLAAAVALGNVLALGSPWVLVRVSSIARRGPADLRRTVRYLLALLAACTAGGVLVGAGLAAGLGSGWLPGGIGADRARSLVVIAGVALAFGSIASAVLRGLERYALLQATAVAARLALVAAIVGAAVADPFVTYVAGLAAVELASLALVAYLLAGVARTFTRGAGRAPASATLAPGPLLRETGAYYAATLSAMFRADLLVLAVAALAVLAEAASLRLAMQTLAVFHLAVAVIGTPFLPRASALAAGGRDRARFDELFDAVSRLEIATLVPPLVFFCALPADLFALVYGEPYREAAAPAVILAGAVAVRLLLGPMNNALIALRAPRSTLLAELAGLLGVVATVVAAAAGESAVGAALAVLAGTVAWHLAALPALRRRRPALHGRGLLPPRLGLALACAAGALAASGLAVLIVESTLGRAVVFGGLYAAWTGWVIRRVRVGVLGGADPTPGGAPAGAPVP